MTTDDKNTVAGLLNAEMMNSPLKELPPQLNPAEYMIVNRAESHDQAIMWLRRYRESGDKEAEYNAIISQAEKQERAWTERLLASIRACGK